MRVLIAASELYPFVKTGGLADVIASLSRALALQGLDVQLILPSYPAIKNAIDVVDDAYDVGGPFSVNMPFRLLACRLKNFDLPVWLVDCPRLYEYPGSIYDEPDGLDQSLNAMRFATLSWAAAAIGCGRIEGWQPDVVHCHDWHTGLVPLFVKRYRNRFAARNPGCILTIHNLAFQGHFAPSFVDVLGLRHNEFDRDRIKATNTICYLESGIIHADKVTTVSPTYSREILTSEYGCGLEQILHSRTDGISGILNGVDYSVWNPAYDRFLPVNFQGAGENERQRIRAQLQAECGLEPSASAPILTFTNRVTHQKMADCLFEVLPAVIQSGAQFVAMGSGQKEYTDKFEALAKRFAGRVFYKNGYDEGLEHRIHSGGDVCLSPSRFEPCGLNPLYAMRYGSVPLVRATGGIKDSIVDATAENVVAGKANGIVFQDANATSLSVGIARAIKMFSDRQTWARIQNCGMQSSFRWKTAADQYRKIYDAVNSKQQQTLPAIMLAEYIDAKAAARSCA